MRFARRPARRGHVGIGRAGRGATRRRRKEPARRFEAKARQWARAELAKRGNRRRSLTLLQGTFAFRTVPATLRVDDTSAALNTAVEVGIVRVDADAYRRHAMDTLKQTGELLPGCVQQGEREHFAVRFGKDSSSNADE